MEWKIGLVIHRRCAPIQIGLGYPGTSGSKSIDYIADKVIIPEENKNSIQKKLYLLTHICKLRKIEISTKNL